MFLFKFMYFMITTYGNLPVNNKPTLEKGGSGTGRDAQVVASERC